MEKSQGIKAGLLVIAFLCSSCASQLHRGVVAMKIDDSTAHVGLNRSEVKIGDHVELYGNDCRRDTGGQDYSCQKFSKGHGRVTQILNDNYAAIKFDPGVMFKEGDYIEKHTH